MHETHRGGGRDNEHRVVITGIGLVTPLGIGKDAFWNALLSGAVAVAPVTRFDASAFPSRIAAEIANFDASSYLDRRRIQWTDRFSQLAVTGALLACEDAAIGFENRTDVGVYTGSALGGLAFAEEQIDAFRTQGLRAVRPLLTLSVFGGAAASNIAIQFGLHGPTIANADSCAAGAIAIGQAFAAIRSGEIRAAIAGGVEAPLAPLTYGAFTVARAMSTRNEQPLEASRPFDRDRDGFVMAEGAGILVSSGTRTQPRGARIYAEITDSVRRTMRTIWPRRWRTGRKRRARCSGRWTMRAFRAMKWRRSTLTDPRPRSETARKSTRIARCSANAPGAFR